MYDSTQLRTWAIAAVLALAPGLADAAGLGRLAVRSSLGQAFQAEIDLTSVRPEELGTLTVRLASPDAYRQAGLQYNSAVAGLALSVEKRPNGQPYIKVTSTRPVNEFVVDVLVDMTWASGRIMREYRVLLDPPGMEPAPAVAESQPAPAPIIAAPQPAPARPVESRPAPSGEYGPVKRGETLSQIARGVRPEGVTVEQMLVGLYRSNPDAFIRKNMNLMRSGKILRVPERDEVAAIPQQEAVKEFRAQVADWNAYRQKLADAAAPAPEGGAATSGRITARVDDQSGVETKDVVRLSKGEPPGAATGKEGGAKGGKERIRALEEEIVSKDKALQEANERVAQLEKTIKDMQRLMEIKSAGLATAQQKAEEAGKPAPVPAPDAKAQPPQTKAPATPLASDVPKPKPAAKPPVKPVAVASLPPEPTLLETLLDNPLYLGGAGVVLLGGLGFLLARRRRGDDGAVPEPVAPTFGAGDSGPVLAAAGAGALTATAEPAESAAEVDPMEEARIYIMHGRDEQAEAILKEALAKDSSREDAHLKLLEIYAARKNKAEYARSAGELEKLTGGAGENWLKAAAMGYAFDPENPLYAAGRAAEPAAPTANEARAVDMDLDFDVTAGGSAPAGDAARENDQTVQSAPAQPDFSVELPPAEPPAPVAKTPDPDPPPLDFNIELPKIEVPPAGGARAQPARDAESASAFKLDDIDLNLDDKPQSADSGGKDAHWYDVQTKFDLAKAYEEMGDKAGARGILEEVVQEGDAEQQAQAKKLLAALG